MSEGLPRELNGAEQRQFGRCRISGHGGARGCRLRDGRGTYHPEGLLALVPVSHREGDQVGGAKDDGQRMHPRLSFKMFLEVVKSRSSSWENVEMDAIHSLQLILRDCFREAGEETSNSKAMINSQFGELELQGINELGSVAREMLILIETAIAPIFAVDTDGRINGWNAKVAKLTGHPVEEAMGKSLVKDLVFEEFADVVNKLLYRALRGEEDKNVELKMKTFGSQHRMSVIFLMVNAYSKRDYTNNIIGVCFVGQDVTGQKLVMDKFIHIQGDHKAIVHSPNPLIPPIFASDENTSCSEWNTAMGSRGEMIDLNHYVHK